MTEATNKLTVLKAEAEKLGVDFHKNISESQLEARITAFKESGPELSKEDIMAAVKASESEYVRSMKDSDARNHIRDKCNELVRIRVVCMNPAKREHKGEVFTGINDVTTIKKFVPFNVDFHVPRILVNVIKDRQFAVYSNVKLEGGGETRKPRLIPEFTVAELDNLTDEELSRLRADQQARGTVGN